MSVATWLTVDAVLDNFIATETQLVDGSEAAENARHLRERGWAQQALHPLRGQGPVGWPPLDATLGVELSEAELAFVCTHVDDAIGITALLLAGHLHPQVRVEQEQSMAGLESVRADLQRLRS